jgi:hypothetical protein
MPDLIALRAVFGQDEANHGTVRYRVGADGTLTVPPEVAAYLIKNGGFAAAKRSEPVAREASIRRLVVGLFGSAASCHRRRMQLRRQ